MSSLLAPTGHSDDALAGPERAAGACPTGLAPLGVMSPELALVSPELAEAARRRLPDRPWEVALRRSRPSMSRDQGSGAAVSMARFGPRDGALSHSPGTASDGRARRRQLLRRLVLAVAVVGALAVGVPRLDVWRSSGEERVLTPDPSVRIISGETQVEAHSPLLPRAGYVVSPGGSFMTDASGSMIEFFTLPLRCGAGSRQLVIQDIPVSGPSLRFVGKAVGRAITVRLSGRILDRKHVRGVVAAHGSLCKPDPVAFSARVS